MKNGKGMWGIILAGVLLCACNGKKGYEMWEHAPVVASKVSIDGEDMIKLDLSLLKDTIVFPLSHFMEEFEIVKLSDDDEALVYPAATVVSDNYILAGSGRNPHGPYQSSIPLPCKLFDKKGNFITEVGAIGQGPGEYTLIYCMQIDEAAQRIYLLPWNSDKIFTYDFLGRFQGAIQLPYRASKGVFNVQGDRVSVAIVPFGYNPSVAWVQTLDGEVLCEIPTGHFVAPDYSNEVMFGLNTDAIDLAYWYWPARADTLYHIDAQRGKLIPRFTADFTKDGGELELHSYVEWPGYFVGNTSAFVYVSRGDGEITTEGKKPAHYIIDKATLKGAFFRIENDYLGKMSTSDPLYLFNKGRFVWNIEPAALAERLDLLLESDHLPAKTREKLTKIKNEMGEDDNNYVIHAKMKHIN